MKTTSSLWRFTPCTIVVLTVFLGVNALSQTSGTTLPVVTIQATDPRATWSGDPGVFTFFRAGPTNMDLDVYYNIGGTATNGVDYAPITHSAYIPAGQRMGKVVISPINLGQTDNRSVVLRMGPSPLAVVPNYIIGTPSNAVVLIGTNFPPVVRISTPTNNTFLPGPMDVLVCADARDADGYVDTVEFFANGVSLGIRTNNPMAANPLNPFCVAWSNMLSGQYALTALATDNAGAQTLSPPVNVVVGPQVPPPPQLAVVNVIAIDPYASEIPEVPPGMEMPQRIDPAVFRILRNGDTNITLTVAYDLGGTASNGVDYVKLPGSVDIPAGASYADVVVLPIDDFLVEGTETVILTLPPMACITIYPPPPTCYQVGPYSRAIAYILDNDLATNFPPVVRISSPPNGAIFRAPVDIPLFAYARDPDDAVSSAEFFDDGNSLGFGKTPVLNTGVTSRLPPTNVFFLVWSNAPLGNHVLTALATDSRGAASTSPPVSITVFPPPPPPTNPPPVPVVSIVAIDPIAIEGTNCWTWPGLTNPVPTWTSWSTAGPMLRPFTNCGPKNATFAVRRMGPTNDAITVSYFIGGTATNGADYLPLAGSVTIPAGERVALIPIVPIDDGQPDRSRTVVLRLVPDSASPPAYLVGFPRAAAALILDSLWPRPPIRLLADRCFHLAAAGPDGAWFRIEYTTDMRTWIPVCVNQVVNGAIDFIDPDAAADQSRFYRAVPELTVP